jgi:hypothetical protein
MAKHKTLHFFWAAFPLSLLILLLQVMPALAQRAAGKTDSITTWTGGPNLPGPLVRAVGVLFPANSHFYAVGGRSSDLAGSDSTNPFDYNPTTNMWTTVTAAFPDNQVNNMACGVLTVGTTPQIYCVGGSAAGGTTAAARVFSYNPVANTITTLTAADNWPGNTAGTILPGGFVVVGNKLYITGGFNINIGMTHQTWVFDPTAAVGSRWTQKADYLMDRGYIPTAAIGNVIYTAGGSLWDGTTLHDTADSFKYNIATDTWTAITNIPRVTAETRALNFFGQMWVMGGGRDAPNPSNEVDIYNPNCNTWGVGTPFVTARRNFPADTDGVFRVLLAGGYAPTSPDMTMEIYRAASFGDLQAFSRKVHGGAGAFSVSLPLTGTAGIECRIGPTYQMIINFGVPVTVGSASLTCGTGSVSSFSVSGLQVTVNLTGVTNAQRITVTLGNVNDGTNTSNIPISMGVLVGDVNGNAVVNASDVSLTKSQVGNPVTSSNFREDVNANGTISATDVALVKSDVGTALPP